MPDKPKRNQQQDPQPSPARSANMASVGSKDTKPELAVRRLLHRLGYRYRLHQTELPGTPDICFPSRRKAIFIHGCFWHRHEGCSRTTTPKTRTAFWEEKFSRNIVRDRSNQTMLAGLGWDTMIVWECETTDIEALKLRLVEFIERARTLD